MKKLLLTVFISVFAVYAIYAETVYEADVMIVGGGMAGLAAGAALAEKGLMVTVLEKSPEIGGSARYVESVYSVVDIGKEFNKIMNQDEWNIDSRLVRNWLENTKYAAKWLEGTQTTGLVEAFAAKIEKNGQIITNATVNSLLTKNGNVTNVTVVDNKGELRTFGARRAVIVATGGFASNKDLVADNIGHYTLAVPLKGRDGDGIRMMELVGALSVKMNAHIHAGFWLKDVSYDDIKGRYAPLQKAMDFPYLKTDRKGVRITNENIHPAYLANAYQAAGGECYALFDENTKNEMAGGDIAALDALIEEAVKKGIAFRASSLNGLAKGAGMDSSVLKGTVAVMGEFAANGYDREFFKDAEWLRPLNEGPFYAVRLSLRTYGTAGGVRVNEYFQPVKVDGKPIEGLYAIGNDAAMPYVADGTPASWAAAGALIVAEHIAVKK